MPNNPDVTLHIYQILEEEYAALHGSIPEKPLRFSMPSGDGRGERVVEATLGWDFHAGHIRDAAGFADYLLHGPAKSGAARREETTTGAGARREDKGQPAEALRARRPEGRRLEALRDYLVWMLGEDFLKLLAAPVEARRAEAEGAEAENTEAVGGQAGGKDDEPALDLEAQLIKRLNEALLTAPDLYAEDRFVASWLRVSTRELLARYETDANAPVEEKDEAEEKKQQADTDVAAEKQQADETLHRLNRLLIEDAFPGYFERIYDVRLAAMFRRLHDAEMSALCLSGGGIRSGTFALGLLQGLARHDLLKQFDYLSTVSGGGYVGSWLTAWLHRHPEGLVGVNRELRNTAPATRIDPDPKPIRNLREYSNFITPKAGLLTADTWSFVGIYLRNLLLNWLVFIPLLAAALMLPRLLLTVTLIQPVREPKTISAAFVDTTLKEGRASIPAARRMWYEPEPIVETFAGERVAGWLYDVPVLGWVLMNIHWRHLLLLVGFGSGIWALGFVIFNRPGLRGMLRRRSRYWHARTDQRAFIKHCLTWLLISTACLTTYWAWSQEGSGVSKNPLAFLLFGVVFTGAASAVAAYVLRKRRARLDDPEPEPSDDVEPKDALPWSGMLATLLAGLVAGLLFWVVSLFDIGDPVLGYGASVRNGEIIRRPFAWTDWTQWTWWGSWTTELYVCLGVPIFLLIYWAGLTAFIGVSSANKRIDDEDREWWARFGAWLLISALGWLALTALVIFGPLALLESPKLLASIGGLSGLIAVLLGRSAVTPAGGKGEEGNTKGSKAAGLMGSALPLFGAIFLGAFVALVSLGTTALTRKVVTLADENVRVRPTPDPATGLTPPAFGWRDRAVQWLTNVPKDVESKGSEGGRRVEWSGPNHGFDDYVRYVTPTVPTLVRPTPTPRPDATPCQPFCGAGEAAGERPEEADAFKGAQIVHLNVLHHTSFWFTLLLTGLLFVAGRYLSRKINLNVFSLHGGYRNRLIRAFLGASRPPGERRPNPFTGFDPSDNIHMHELRWALFDEGDFLKPAELAKELREGNHQIAVYLRKHGLIENLMREPVASNTPGLVEALRTDLNGALQQRRLYETFSVYLTNSRRAAEAREAITKSFRKPPDSESLDDTLRSDYQLLLNRLVLEEAFPGTLRPGPPPPYKLMHIVNTALNLVGGEKLAWQQRKAEPFSFSPLHSGCFRLGYRRSRDYGGRETGGISIGTAATISGAAASSNMGYYTTSPIISLLLTLFNVRLGWWLGNPGPAGDKTYQRNRPESSVAPVLYEAFGMTNDRYEYVYLTDGGHFENLAVYEMVLRRCRFVIVADGAQDEHYRFGDLGNAVRKIRIDLGVPIEFPCIAIHGGAEGTGMYWALGRIRYSCVDGTRPEEDGLLLYIKPAVYGDEPRDVIEYKNSFPAFPHQSTGDQFFDEPQFESYRALGSHIMDRLCGEGFEELSVGQVVARAREEMLRHCRDLDPDFVKWLGRLAGDGEPKQGGGAAG